MTEGQKGFAARLAELKKECGIVNKTRAGGNSKFALVRKVFMEANSSREEAMWKLLTALKAQGVDIKANHKKITALVGNFLTYVRNTSGNYKAYAHLELIDTPEKFQVVERK